MLGLSIGGASVLPWRPWEEDDRGSRTGQGERCPAGGRRLARHFNSFGELFNEYFDRTYDVAYRIVRNSDVAAEVAQDVLAGRLDQAGLAGPA
ncbi:MAG: hypothetical protein R2704_16535 [Microthrixaceae bacterium]